MVTSWAPAWLSGMSSSVRLTCMAASVAIAAPICFGDAGLAVGEHVDVLAREGWASRVDFLGEHAAHVRE